MESFICQQESVGVAKVGPKHSSSGGFLNIRFLQVLKSPKNSKNKMQLPETKIAAAAFQI